jgi:hypothetical protein
MLDNSSSSSRSIRVTILLISSSLLVLSGVVFWQSENGTVLELPEASQSLAKEWQQLGQDESIDSFYSSRMVEAFHKIALACGKDQACLTNARTSLKSTFNELKKGSTTVIPPNEAALFQEMKKLDQQWTAEGGKLALEENKKVVYYVKRRICFRI